MPRWRALPQPGPRGRQGWRELAVRPPDAGGCRSASHGLTASSDGIGPRWCSRARGGEGPGSGSRARQPPPGMGCGAGAAGRRSRHPGARATTAVPASRLLEAVSIHLNTTRSMVHLGAGAEAARSGLPWSGDDGASESWGRGRRGSGRRGACDVDVRARRGLALRIEPAVTRGHAIAGEGPSGLDRVSTGGRHGREREQGGEATGRGSPAAEGLGGGWARRSREGAERSHPHQILKIPSDDPLCYCCCDPCNEKQFN